MPDQLRHDAYNNYGADRRQFAAIGAAHARLAEAARRGASAAEIRATIEAVVKLASTTDATIKARKRAGARTMATKVNSLDAWVQARNALVQDPTSTLELLSTEPFSADPASDFQQAKRQRERIMDQMQKLAVVGIKQIDAEIAGGKATAVVTKITQLPFLEARARPAFAPIRRKCRCATRPLTPFRTQWAKTEAGHRPSFGGQE